jgi:hypothetical protein
MHLKELRKGIDKSDYEWYNNKMETLLMIEEKEWMNNNIDNQVIKQKVKKF